ncbi:MAG: hypothetical protein JWN95_2590 [Frankiales bacterium]|nr:hypothetical protein [Frankiales bacterium]
MSLSSIWRIMLRRWYVTLFGLVFTAALTVGAGILSPPTYEADASVLLIPPKTAQSVNPFMGLGGLQEVADVVSRAASDAKTTDALLAAGGTAQYAVGRDTSSTGPIILITATADSAQQALLSVKFLVDRLGPSLEALQSAKDVPLESFITQYDLSSDQTAKVQRKAQLRSCITAAALGILFTVLLVAFAEKILRRRGAGNESTGGDPSTADPHESRYSTTTYPGSGGGSRSRVASRRNRRATTRRPDRV